MIKYSKCIDCGRVMPMYHNANRCYDCAMRHRKEYDRKRRKIKRSMKQAL